MKLEEKFKSQFSGLLLTWYGEQKRDLPWRRTTDPYKIWVSEVMLQQTQVKTVLPYYDRFIERFPTVEALANSDLEAVLKVWEGLGYYARARNLHRAAETIVREYDKQMPSDYESLIGISGIGPYSAAAVASIAFNRNYAVVDGNVTRVICRIFGISEPAAENQVKIKIKNTAAALLMPGRASEFNQAMMELGALICLPKSPSCGLCPVSSLCQAQSLPRPDLLPTRTPAKKVPHYDIAVGIVWQGDRVLIDKRPTNGLLGGLWEFPGGKKEADETLEECVKRELREELGVEVRIQAPFMTVRHAYTHFKITLHAFECRLLRGKPRPKTATAARWVQLQEMQQLPFPRANKRILERLLEMADD